MKTKKNTFKCFNAHNHVDIIYDFQPECVNLHVVLIRQQNLNLNACFDAQMTKAAKIAKHTINRELEQAAAWLVLFALQ